MTIAIQDANILIDCARIALLDAVFRLPLRFKTTDLVWAEISDPEQQSALQVYIDTGQLAVVSFRAHELQTISAKMQDNAGLSLEDCSAWYLAEQQTALLLTGDDKLRKVCRRAGIRVHGILWLLDEVLKARLLSRQTACEKIRALQRANVRLPAGEVTKRVRVWCGENAP